MSKFQLPLRSAKSSATGSALMREQNTRGDLGDLGDPDSVPRAPDVVADKAAVLATARATRSAADEALTMAARCTFVARSLGLRVRAAAAYLARRSTKQLVKDAPVVAALAAGHEAIVTAYAAADEATIAATHAADAAMTLELEAESLT